MQMYYSIFATTCPDVCVLSRVFSPGCVFRCFPVRTWLSFFCGLHQLTLGHCCAQPNKVFPSALGLFICLFLFLFGAEDGTQGLVYARSCVSPLSYTPVQAQLSFSSFLPFLPFFLSFLLPLSSFFTFLSFLLFSFF
jgi:hypothetical protein